MYYTMNKNDVSNNISIDLSAYPLKTNVDSSLDSSTTNRQNNLTFTYIFLNTNNLDLFKSFILSSSSSVYLLFFFF